MVELIKATGERLECDSVTKGAQFPYLYIHTHNLGWADAVSFFSSGLEEITVIETFTVAAEGGEADVTQTRVYSGYTVLYSIQQSPLFDNPSELMIWLKQPEV